MHIGITFPGVWRCAGFEYPKIECVKAIRRITGYGLKDAMTLCNTHGVRHSVPAIELPEYELLTLQKCGCKIDSAGVLLYHVLKAHDRAIELNELPLAEELSTMITLLTLKYNVT